MSDPVRVNRVTKISRSDDEIYHDLMPYKVREILLVATNYDAFILDQEGQLTEIIYEDYFKLNLSSAPRITSVTSGDDALVALEERSFDMVILMMRIAGMSPFILCEKIKKSKPDLPVILLLKDNAEISLYKQKIITPNPFDNVFVWNGDSKVFVAMIKYVEDQINADNDTEIGFVRVILLVEDSIRYYSRFLPILYVEIIKHTQQLMDKDSPYEQKLMLRMRARPKILTANNYEDAVKLIEKYKDYLLCVISDVCYEKDNKLDNRAGLKLVRYLRKNFEDLPAVLQSSDSENIFHAQHLHTTFIKKNSETLETDLHNFFVNYLGFGDFIFRNSYGEETARARSLEEIRKKLARVSLESLKYHGARNHFSAWLMARGEIQIAKKIQPIKVSQFKSLETLRTFLVNVFQKVQYEATRGKVVRFDEAAINEKGHTLRLGDGSLGGKGRGLTYMNYLIETGKLPRLVRGVPIRVPQTCIIGTHEFDRFIQVNAREIAFENPKYIQVKKRFVNGILSDELMNRLWTLLKHVKYPLAIRSSSLFEDSLSQPFSGVYSTFILPNNDPSIEVRLNHLTRAIKLVYASVFSTSARAYFEAIQYKIEEEKMAVVIQEVVGDLHGDLYYPHFSGVAQSSNYYPFSYMKPEDGIAVIAAGLGKHVVDGEKSYRFCPKYPKLEIQTPEDLLKNTQRTFYAVSMNSGDFNLINGENVTLSKESIERAEKDGALDHIASVWDYSSQRVQEGLGYVGPRILNFADILRFDYFPLAKIIMPILDILQRRLGTAVEIEFAVELTKNKVKSPAFYLLQVKHFVKNMDTIDIDPKTVNSRELFVFTDIALGNGRIDDVSDIIFVDPESFDHAKMEKMTLELAELNKTMVETGRRYILLGPGRWGTRDPWLGIPIAWQQISNACVIVEAGLKDFQVDASMGSHFFHNLVTMNVGYLSVPYSGSCFIDWEWVKKQAVKTRTDHCVHVRLKKPVKVLMDGRKGFSVIYK